MLIIAQLLVSFLIFLLFLLHEFLLDFLGQSLLFLVYVLEIEKEGD